MKPNIFIGSSVEGLPVANAIQQNLEYDADVTIWNQGIFQLSSTALDDLIKALNNFDFGIFVFRPDDLTLMRESQVSTVRDNVLFEFGLFIGRLGKDKVFFLLPKNAQNFHLPTDLVGMNRGVYDTERGDGNLQAALGPFCNQVREQVKEYIYDEKFGLANESKKAKTIVRDKPFAWEFLLAAELLNSKLVRVNNQYNQLESGRTFISSKQYDVEGFFQFFKESLSDIQELIRIFTTTLTIDIKAAFGEPGVTGEIDKIKSCADKLISICDDLLLWELRVQQAIPPEGLLPVKSIMNGWTKQIVEQINVIPLELIKAVEAFKDPNSTEKERAINLVLEAPKHADEVMPYFERALGLR